MAGSAMTCNRERAGEGVPTAGLIPGGNSPQTRHERQPVALMGGQLLTGERCGRAGRGDGRSG